MWTRVSVANGALAQGKLFYFGERKKLMIKITQKIGYFQKLLVHVVADYADTVSA